MRGLEADGVREVVLGHEEFEAYAGRISRCGASPVFRCSIATPSTSA